MSLRSSKTSQRERFRRIRHRKVRARVSGTAERPRVAVYKSLRFLYIQVIDDASSHTLFALSTKNKTTNTPELLGKALAEECAKRKITSVVFDRGGHRYMGNIKLFADSARKHKLQF